MSVFRAGTFQRVWSPLSPADDRLIRRTHQVRSGYRLPPRPPDKPLVLWKWADRTSAQIGDVVTFTLKYSNHGGRPISDIAVVDNLTGRLEYVEGQERQQRAREGIHGVH